MAPSKTPDFPEEVWRLIIQHGVTITATSDYRTWDCYHSDEVNDQLRYDPTTQFNHQRLRRDYNAMLNLSQTCRFFHDLVADELYQYIVLCDDHGIKREKLALLLRTLLERPEIRDRVKHITMVPWFGLYLLKGKDIKKMDMQAQGIIDTAGLELANLPINRRVKKSTAWLERALAALVCLSTGLRSLSIQDPPPASGWKSAWMWSFDVDGFERVIRNIRDLPTSQGKIFQKLEAVSVLTTRSKNDSKEAFTVYSSPRLTGFQALGFLSMKDWHRLADFRSILVHLDIGHLYPQLFHVRWIGLDKPNPARAREAAQFRRILSTFNRLKFLRISYTLLIGHLEEETKRFGDMISELLPQSVEDFQIAVFNHGGLGSWTWELEQKGYWFNFRATHRDLRKFGILVHQKGNSRDQSEFWITRRSINLKRLRTWLASGDNYMDPSEPYHAYLEYVGYPSDREDDEEDATDNATYDGYCPRGTLQTLQAQLEQLGVDFQVSTFQPPMFRRGSDELPGGSEGYVRRLI
ncbi:hypothetical protein B0H65DRAFT_579391 [Neurospora tetraspora]|uniref:Uncharacterized protein n=1 Tax=Neurospora tetraspora TaxID=94610 RepID=A0AAE0JCC3_9PEZI|nr:hypothetical protein B0H65DRAFT_579391 [Neurospora tetraspora]